MLTRLARVKPFALSEAMVPAAANSTQAEIAIGRYLIEGRRELRARVISYLQWLQGPDGRAASAEEAQRRFTFGSPAVHFSSFFLKPLASLL